MGMQGYSSSCHDAPWFFEIDLLPVFYRTAEVILGSADSYVDPALVQEELEREYGSILDKTLLDKAMWDVAKSMFFDEKLASKVFTALNKSYQPALEHAHADRRPMQPLQRVEVFTRHWIDDSVCRAWQPLTAAGQAFDADRATTLFQNLLAPFGDDNAFSCIPQQLS